MRFRFVLTAPLVAAWSLAPSVAARADDSVRLNQIQVVGTHNSYHIAPHPNILGLIDQKERGRSAGLDYTHRPLADQFTRLGVRQIELDVFADPRGGHYAQPAARAILRAQNLEPGADPAADPEFTAPGLKVFHIQDIDYMSRATTFTGALRQVRDWSTAHPHHVPILILVETKQTPIPALPTQPIPFGVAEFAAIDAAILEVFGRAGVIAPDDVRGELRDSPRSDPDPGVADAGGVSREGPVRARRRGVDA